MAKLVDAERGALQGVVDGLGAAILQFADNVTEVVRSEGRTYDVEVAVGLREALRIQTGALSRGFAQMIERASPEQRTLLDSQTIDMGAVALVDAAQSFAAKSALAPIGIVDIIEAIKKILELILKFLGVSMQDWLRLLIDIIDNLIDAFGGLLGFKEAQRAQRAHAMLHRHLREIYRTDAARTLSDRARREISEEEET